MNILDNRLIASNCSSPNFANGAAGAGFSNAYARAVVAAGAASVDESLSIAKLCGKNSTVRMIGATLVRGMKTW